MTLLFPSVAAVEWVHRRACGMGHSCARRRYHTLKASSWDLCPTQPRGRRANQRPKKTSHGTFFPDVVSGTVGIPVFFF